MSNMFGKPENRGPAKASLFADVRWLVIGLAIAIGSLVVTSSASAEPKYSCSQATQLYYIYNAAGWTAFGLGDSKLAFYYWGKAMGTLDASC
jgi:hypothetical protein